MKKNKRKERGKGQEMKGRDFYQMIKERQEAGGQTAGSREAGMSELTAATILDGAQAGGKFLLKGEREAQDFAESHAGTGVFMVEGLQLIVAVLLMILGVTIVVTSGKELVRKKAVK